ncbi:MAG: TPM domain-containing protein [Pseudomonadota bacterium]
MRGLGLLLCSAALLAAPAARAEQLEIPVLTTPVTDLTNTLSPAQREKLEAKLHAFEQEKGVQIALLLVPTVRPETVEQYALRVAESWVLGRRGVDDGALLLVAKNDRQLRIEVGYGLEGAVPDAMAKRIVSELITPHFKKNDFYGGINAGVDALIQLARGAPLPAPNKLQAKAERDKADGQFNNLLLLGLLVIVFLGGVLRKLLGRLLSALILSACFFLLAVVFLASLFSALWVAALVFFMALIFGTGGAASGLGGMMGGRGTRGGGGFSGGGGGFGGGGSSGSW